MKGWNPDGQLLFTIALYSMALSITRASEVFFSFYV